MTSVRIILVFPLWYPVILYLGSHYTTYCCHGPWCSIIPLLSWSLVFHYTYTTYCCHGHHVLLSRSLVFLILRTVALPSSRRKCWIAHRVEFSGGGVRGAGVLSASLGS